MSKTRFLKNMITPTKVEPTVNHEAGAASGVWSLGEQLEARRGGVWPEAGVPDPDTLIENNFSTNLYEGNGSTQTITTGIDSTNKSSLVWIKNRDQDDSHILTDTVRGATKIILAEGSAAEATDADTITAFSSTGFALGADVKVNTNNESYCAWTFKKAPKFFDVVTWDGNNVAGREIPHNLGCAVGSMIIKRTNADKYWFVFHRSIAATHFLRLNENFAKQDSAVGLGDVEPTSTVFTVSGDELINQTGGEYVAYLFAHETGSDSMIQCGSYTGNGNATGPVIDLGWEPQWLLIKNTTDVDDWVMLDTMRGIGATTHGPNILYANKNDQQLQPASSESQATRIDLTPIGFNVKATDDRINKNNSVYVYTAIRRPNMSTITDATKLFATATGNGAVPEYTAGFVVDFAFYKELTSTDAWEVHSRLQGTRASLNFDSTNAEGDDGASNKAQFDLDNVSYQGKKDEGSGFQAWMWARAKGYFDVVLYDGDGAASRDITHALGVVPEMIWVKKRSGGEGWAVYHKKNAGTHFFRLEANDAYTDNDNLWNDETAGTTSFPIDTDTEVNQNGQTYIAFLFATLAGVSFVGEVDHSGSSTDVDCGFSSGARFVLLKRTDATGGWYIWDSVRGIVAGNDPYLLLDTTAANVTNTDLIDPLASGFQISGDFTDGNYIVYAIA